MIGTNPSRRDFLGQALTTTAMLSGGWWWPSGPVAAAEALPGERPARDPGLTVENPRLRVPVSLIIDDSTCLANLAHFAIPQFAQVFPDRYRQDWKALPREIPDAFVRKFGEWCLAHGVKGKYSIVPYPACVGWLDRELPGWSRPELEASLNLVREVLLPNWDIHPEMISHTWAIDTKTGRPFAEKSERTMENWRWTDGKTVDQMADYLGYALRILKNVGLPCEGITTPGGFGNRVLPELSRGTFEAVRDVFGAEIPHYFRHLYTDERSVAPRVEYAAGLQSGSPECVVSIIGCTGDWFGGWDGLEIGRVDQFITEDGRGRLPEVIARGEPAVLVCHWPGIYCNGDETGFRIFQDVVGRLHARYDHLVWMTLSQISRYWAARELTGLHRSEGRVLIQAPFACPDWTLRITGARADTAPLAVIDAEGKAVELTASRNVSSLAAGQYLQRGDDLIVCFKLQRGVSTLRGMTPV